MTAQQVWGVADQVRRQLTPRPNVPRLDLERVTHATGGMCVNGHVVSMQWDLEWIIRDSRGHEALSVTEPIRPCPASC